ncbi:hypothetical protein ANCCEY_12340 [Ancylostoma ceylanicum]|uniref:RNA-directed DNA polymerase n=1 Tax=Ancylostoma ceylanicum TaxID=53326 RepID=A0A0D6L9G5_9BILA|nr:hypothetical protein ANCCEY_12340 [Ancylostoma ceylanicum]
MTAGLRGVATYLDDILVCGKTEQEHMENLLALFERISEYGLKVRKEKCSLAKPEIRYLGFILDKDGRRPNPEKVEAIKSMAEPKNVGQLRAFLGMITYYSAFMPTMKDLRGPLDALLKKDMKWEWSSKPQTAFEKLKKALSSDLNLAHYDPKQKIVVAADACDYGIGCVISHKYADATMSDSELELLESSFESLVGADDDVEDMIADTPLVVPLENSSDGEDDDGEESGGSDSD